MTGDHCTTEAAGSAVGAPSPCVMPSQTERPPTTTTHTEPPVVDEELTATGLEFGSWLLGLALISVVFGTWIHVWLLRSAAKRDKE